MSQDRDNDGMDKYFYGVPVRELNYKGGAPAPTPVDRVRLIAECYAVLENRQVREIAQSMDLSETQVIALFESNETEWGKLKSSL